MCLLCLSFAILFSLLLSRNADLCFSSTRHRTNIDCPYFYYLEHTFFCSFSLDLHSSKRSDTYDILSFPNIIFLYFSLLRYVQLVTSNSSIYMYIFTFILPHSNLGQTFWTSLHLYLLTPLLNDEALHPFWSLNLSHLFIYSYERFLYPFFRIPLVYKS